MRIILQPKKLQLREYKNLKYYKKIQVLHNFLDVPKSAKTCTLK